MSVVLSADQWSGDHGSQGSLCRGLSGKVMMGHVQSLHMLLLCAACALLHVCSLIRASVGLGWPPAHELGSALCSSMPATHVFAVWVTLSWV